MKVLTTAELTGTERDVTFNAGRSIRILVASDNMGFSLHKTLIKKGGPYHWHYKNHLESCYCLSGSGILENLTTNERFIIKPDTTYVLDQHDNHTFEALEDTVLISVFNPPVTGKEIHKEDGSYELIKQTV
jgi:L-ectoine synthase